MTHDTRQSLPAPQPLPEPPPSATASAEPAISSIPQPAPVTPPPAHREQPEKPARAPVKHPWRKFKLPGSPDSPRPGTPGRGQGEGRSARPSSAPKRHPVLLERPDVPGQRLDIHGAASVAHVNPTAIYYHVTRARKEGRDTIVVNNTTFRLVTPAARDTEARPRHSNGTSTPVNPHVIGGVAPISHAEVDTCD